MGTLSGTRRQARERALALLYEAETRAMSAQDVIAELAAPPAELSTSLAVGVEAHQPELDDLISRFARDWTVDRMPALDRALLRIGAFELVHCPDVPTAVVLSEAVELAQQYSTEDSGRFINGVLAAMATDVRRPDPEAPGP